VKVDEQRRYLGGDSEHTVLVKGLDFALLEQTRGRVEAVTSVQDDESLEDAFRTASSSTEPFAAVPRKRTREEIVQELKEKRGKTANSNGGGPGALDNGKATGIEEVKREGKFKPIGFKPVGAQSASSKGKDKDGVRKKKKRKVDSDSAAPIAEKKPETLVKDSGKDETVLHTSNGTSTAGKKAPDPEPADEVFDIFADAGDYEGVNFDDDDDDDDDKNAERKAPPEVAIPPEEELDQPPPRKWFDDDELPPPPPEHSPTVPADSKGKGKAGNRASQGPSDNEEGELEAEPDKPMRLAPLASSSLPSIRDVLAVDSALDEKDKRKARKEKRKAGGGGEGKKVSAEAKLNRDYQKLKSYTEKKERS